MTMLAFYLILGILVLAMVGMLVYTFVDWRSIFVKKYGFQYRRGLEWKKVRGQWLRFESVCTYEGKDAKTYYHEEKENEGLFKYYTIVPDSLGFDYDQWTGRRMYQVEAGLAVAYGGVSAQTSNYPSELISRHVMGETAINLAKSVNGEDSKFPVKILIILGVVVIVAIVTLKLTGVIGGSSKPVVPAEPGATPSKVVPLPANGTKPVSEMLEWRDA
jgi:hypothetical protein